MPESVPLIAECLSRPITYDWLREHGFRLLAREALQVADHVCRYIGDEILGGRPFLGSFDDLGIELSSCQPDDRWFCWIVKADDKRFIHVRMLRYTWEVEKLYEGLTGRRFQERVER